jgi:hypothetical protein
VRLSFECYTLPVLPQVTGFLSSREFDGVFDSREYGACGCLCCQLPQATLVEDGPVRMAQYHMMHYLNSTQ